MSRHCCCRCARSRAWQIGTRSSGWRTCWRNAKRWRRKLSAACASTRASRYFRARPPIGKASLGIGKTRRAPSACVPRSPPPRRAPSSSWEIVARPTESSRKPSSATGTAHSPCSMENAPMRTRSSASSGPNDGCASAREKRNCCSRWAAYACSASCGEKLKATSRQASPRSRHRRRTSRSRASSSASGGPRKPTGISARAPTSGRRQGYRTESPAKPGSDAESGELLLRIAGARGNAGRKCPRELRDFRCAQADACRSRVLLHVIAPFRSRDRHHVRPLGEHPGERHLRRCRLVGGGDRFERLQQRDVALEVVGIEARMIATSILRLERIQRLDRRGEEPAPERRVSLKAIPSSRQAGRKVLFTSPDHKQV